MADLIDVAARQVAGASRRQSLMALGSAVLAASAPAEVTAAGKKGKKNKKCKKKSKRQCKHDAAACKPKVASICGLTPAQCLEAVNCCNECSANGFLTCLVGVTAVANESFA